MKIFKILFVFIILLIGLFLLLSLFIPGELKLQSELIIQKPIKVVMYEARHLNGSFLSKPWEENESHTKVSYFGIRGKEDSGLKWQNTKEKGNIQIRQITYNKIIVDADFESPYRSYGDGEIVFDDLGDSCAVKWEMTVHSSLIFRIYNLFMGGYLKPIIQRSLTLLKVHCESMEALPQILKVTVQGNEYAGQRGKISFDNFDEFKTRTIEALNKIFVLEDTKPAGPLCGLFYERNENAREADVLIGYPTSKINYTGEVIDTARIIQFEIPVHPDYISTFASGDIRNINSAHRALQDWLFLNEKPLKKPCVEQYLRTKETESDTSRWLTKIIYTY